MRFATAKRCSSAVLWNTLRRQGIHSGDSACSLPPYSIGERHYSGTKNKPGSLPSPYRWWDLLTYSMRLKINWYTCWRSIHAPQGRCLCQQGNWHPYGPKVAAKVIAGKKLSELNVSMNMKLKHVAVKEAVFPFIKFKG